MLLFRSKTLSSRLSPLIPAFDASIYRFFVSTPATQDIPSPDFAAQYLINSCGLSSDKAARVSRYLPRLKSPQKPDAVLRFLRQVGVSEPHIKAAVLRYPRFLCFSVEKCLQPKMSQLQELGFSPSHISLLLAICPNVFAYTTLQKNVLFWLGIFGSIEELLAVLKHGFFFLNADLKTISANMSFLKERCGLSACQIVQLIKMAPGLIASAPEALKNKAKRAEELECSSQMFLHALKLINGLNQSIVDVRINHLRRLGFSHKEVSILVGKLPYILQYPEDTITRKVEFLTMETDCDKLYLVTNPALLTYSLEKRLVPRILVRNILKLRGHPVANQKVFSFMNKTEKKFVEKFIQPYEPDIPGFLRAYEDACAGNVEGLESLKSHSS